MRMEGFVRILRHKEKRRDGALLAILHSTDNSKTCTFYRLPLRIPRGDERHLEAVEGDLVGAAGVVHGTVPLHPVVVPSVPPHGTAILFIMVTDTEEKHPIDSLATGVHAIGGGGYQKAKAEEADMGVNPHRPLAW